MYSGSRDPSNSFKDIRSASKPRRKSRAQRKKYFNYEVIKPGQLSAPHYQASNVSWGWPTFPANIAECEIANLSKQQLFKEAKWTAPSYMTYTGCSCCNDWLRHAYAKEKAAVKGEAFDWDKRLERREFAGQVSHDTRFYDQLADMDADDAWDWEWYRWNYTPDTVSEEHACSAECGWCDEYQPSAVYDLETLVDNAIAGLRTAVREPGWEDLVECAWSSPEMDWVDEGDDLSEDEEDFELL